LFTGLPGNNCNPGIRVPHPYCIIYVALNVAGIRSSQERLLLNPLILFVLSTAATFRLRLFNHNSKSAAYRADREKEKYL